MKEAFISALENYDLVRLQKIAKSDLHNHATRGGNTKFIEKWANIKISNPQTKFEDLSAMQEWYDKNVKLFCHGDIGYVKRIEAAFEQAKEDGISVLCMSFGIDEIVHFNGKMDVFISTIAGLHKAIAPDVSFIPEIAVDRSRPVSDVENEFEKLFAYGYFKSIDLAGNEFAQPIGNFKRIYRMAKDSGLLLKAHVGEFGDAETIIEAVETLDLQQVQHGISAADSPRVMKWLADNKIQLNVCPTSNVMLSRVKDYSSHPIKKLFENGVPVTVNTDDMLIFNQSVSEEFLNLYNSKLFTAVELNEIRETGLKGFSCQE